MTQRIFDAPAVAGSPRMKAGWIRHYESDYTRERVAWRRCGAEGKFRNIKRLCSGVPHDSVLEIGAGDGALLRHMSESGFARGLCAVEISQNALNAISRLGLCHLREAQLYDGSHVPYPQQSFDLVVLSHVVEHLEHPRQLLYEAARVGRRVLVEVPLEDTWWLAPDYTFDAVGHINFFSPKTIRRLLQTSGLVIEKQMIANPPRCAYVARRGKFAGNAACWLKQALLRMWPGLATCLFTYHAALLASPAATPLQSEPAGDLQ